VVLETMKFFCALAILVASSSVLINGDICEPGYSFDHGHVELEGATHILKCDDEYTAFPSSQLLCEGGTLKGEQISCVSKYEKQLLIKSLTKIF